MSVRPHPKQKTEPEYRDAWIIDCYPRGYKSRTRATFVGSFEDAVAAERAIMRHRPDSSARHNNPPIRAIYADWIVWYAREKEKSTVDDAKIVFTSTLLPFLGQFPVKAVSRGMIDRYKQARLDKLIKKRTINKELSYFSSMITWGIRNNRCDKLPFTIERFEHKKTVAAKPRPLTRDQAEALITHMEPKHRLTVLLMIDAGLRKKEALNLRGEDVELSMGVIFVTGKGSKERIVPITTARLRRELENRPRTGYLSINPSTGKPYTTIRKTLLNAAGKAGLDKHIYHHLLRHSFGTLATTSGIDVSAIQAIMGHSDPRTTMIYQHIAADYLKAQARKLDQERLGEERPPASTTE